MDKKTIVITGSTGFLGSYIRSNIRNNYEIIFATTSSLDDGFVKFDSLYTNICEILCNKRIDCIIHNASIIPRNFAEATYQLFKDNTYMVENLFKFTLKNNVKKFIYMSTFGSMTNPKLFDVGDYYTLSKITGELFCSMLNKNGVDATSFRISSPYGEFLKANNVLRIFVNRALSNQDIIVFGDGSREQNFTYAGDILNAIELAIEKDVQGTYEIVGKSNISMFRLAELIIDIVKSKSKIIFDGIDPQENYRPKYSYKKAFKDFGYFPKTRLKDGLKKYIDWVKYENSVNI
jgi:putative UDP-glucose 4-epimerase